MPTSNNKGVIYGKLGLQFGLYCLKEVLGKEVEVLIGNQKGHLVFPKIPPDYLNAGNEKKRINLLPPENNVNWKQGNKTIQWGYMDNNRAGHARVFQALLKFDVENANNIKSIAKTISQASNKWEELFLKYVEIISNQYISVPPETIREDDKFCLLTFNSGKLNRILGTKFEINVMPLRSITPMYHDLLIKVCDLTSSIREIPLEHLVWLEAHHALKQEDFRKVIIESATSAEITLRKRINEEFEKIGLSEKLKKGVLKRYRTLGGHIDLIKALEIDLPNPKIKEIVNKPRIDVIHRGIFPERKTAVNSLDAVKHLMNNFSINFFTDDY
jgi:hypothetical protein